MRKELTETEEAEIEQSLDDELKERVNNVYLLRSALDRHAHNLIDDWGSIPFNINDEFSYDLGRHDGIEFALKLLEHSSQVIQEQVLLH